MGKQIEKTTKQSTKQMKNVKSNSIIHTTNSDSNAFVANSFLWGIGLLLIGVVCFAGPYLKGFIVNDIIRNLALFLLFCVACAILMITKQGKFCISFFQESKIELRKIIWPTKSETNQTALIVIALAVVISLILWAFDAVIFRVIDFVVMLGA